MRRSFRGPAAVCLHKWREFRWAKLKERDVAAAKIQGLYRARQARAEVRRLIAKQIRQAELVENALGNRSKKLALVAIRKMRDSAQTEKVHT